jgi:hypothetical protein
VAGEQQLNRWQHRTRHSVLHGHPLHEAPGTLEEVLDYMHDNDLLVLQRYRVGNHFQRRAGGQDLVQFVEREHDSAPLAVKVRR